MKRGQRAVPGSVKEAWKTRKSSGNSLPCWISRTRKGMVVVDRFRLGLFVFCIWYSVFDS